MKLIKTEVQPSCIAGGFVYVYHFDQPFDQAIIQAFGRLGTLKYYADFPKPMFEIKCRNKTLIRGVESANECKVIFARATKRDFHADFEQECANLTERIEH